MYRISRLLLVLSVLLACYSGTLVTILAWPTSAWVIAAGVAVHRFRRRSKQLDTLGSARWADEAELRRTGMLNAATGLLLGRIRATGMQSGRFMRLLSWRVSAKDACLEFWKGVSACRQHIVRLPQAVHVAVFGPTGGGKGVSCIIPFLLTCKESCVVVDFKGENYGKTARHRARYFGHQVVLLDPFKVIKEKQTSSDTFNPLDFIDKDNEYAIDHCNDLAKALVVRTGEEHEPHWNDSAEAWIAAILATVVQYGGTETRSLQTVRDFLSHPKKLEMAIRLMCESECWDGMLRRMGGQLLHFVEKEKSSVLTTVSRHLRFLDTLAVAASTKSSSFDPAKLRSGKMTVYLVLPPEHMRAQSPLLRVWIGSLLRAVVSGGLQAINNVHFLLDESASLGSLDAIDDALDKYRGFGVRLQFYFQSLGQLKKCFPEGQEQTLLSNTTQMFFGVNDNATAEYVSNRIGESTIVVESGGSSRGRSTNWSHGQSQPQYGGGGSFNSSSNWQQQVRKLLKPEEVMTLDPRTAITFVPSMSPVCTRLLRYYEEPKLGRSPGWFKRSVTACSVLAVSAATCVAMLVAAGTLSMLACDYFVVTH